MNRYITAILGFILSVSVQSGSLICPDQKNFGCLVKNSFSIYRENPGNWWEMYYHAQKNALTCKSEKEMAIFLGLWSGETDGEMRSGITNDTELLIKNKTQCFLNGFISLSESSQMAMLNNYCPFQHADILNHALEPYEKEKKYSGVVGLLIARHNECQAMVNKHSNMQQHTVAGLACRLAGGPGVKEQ